MAISSGVVKIVGAAAFAAVALASRSARADEIDDLEKSLNDESMALSTADCTSACRALASIRRAADRICALEQGTRCVAAQQKAMDAARRVRDACPQCAAAAVTPEQPKPMVTPQKSAPMPPPPSASDTSSPASENAPSRGGCASCDATGVSPGDLSSAALLAVTVAALLRRKKKSRQRP